MTDWLDRLDFDFDKMNQINTKLGINLNFSRNRKIQKIFLRDWKFSVKINGRLTIKNSFFLISEKILLSEKFLNFQKKKIIQSFSEI